MKPIPKVSVVTPCLNQVAFLPECLASVASASTIAEHIVVDGGSTDGTVELLQNQTFAAWTSEPDAGQTDAINKGLARSVGNILCYLCGDDLLAPGALEAVVAGFDRDPDIDFVYGDGWFLEGLSGWRRLKRAGSFSYPRLLRGNFLIQPAVFFRRSLLERIGGFDARLVFCMDHEYWLRAGPSARWHYLEQPLAMSRLHPDAKTSARLPEAWAEAAAMQRRYGIRWRPAFEALWMKFLGHRYYRMKRILFSRIGPTMARMQ